jgi:predicted secreted protein
MRWTSIVAIYLLFWVMSAFLVLPFGIRTHEEAGEALVPDRPAAPPPISARAVWLRATVLSAVLFGLFYANLHYGWVTLDDVSVIHPPVALTRPGY